MPDRRPDRGRPELGMAAGTVASRLTGLLRVLAMSYALGGTPLADAYNLANTAPNMIYDLVLGGVLAATLIPVFVAELRPGRDDAGDGWAGVSAVVTLAVVLLAAACLLVYFAAPEVISGYTAANPLKVAGPERAVATSLLRLFVPQIFCYGAISLTAALLNARGRFVAPMFVPVANNLVAVATLLAAGTLLGRAAVDGARVSHSTLLLLGVGTTAGVVVQMLLLLPLLRGAGVRLRWNWAPRHPAVRTMLRLSGWTVGIVVANQLALFVVLVLANSRSGGVTVYTYAYTFFQLPFALVAVSIMTARQPAWAAAWVAADVGRLRREVATALRPLLALITPIAALLAAVADPLARLVLAHGQMTAGQAALTGRVLAVLALGLPGFCAFLFYVRVFQAMQDTRTAFRLYLVENGVNVVLAAALYRPAGVPGVAASVSAAYTVAAVLAAARLRRVLGGGPVRGHTPARVAWRSLLVALPAAAGAWLAEHAVGSTSTTGSLVRLAAAGGAAAVWFGALVLVTGRRPADRRAAGPGPGTHVPGG